MKSSEAIAVLGGSLVRGKNGKWRTTNFREGDEFGALGDRLRVVAVSFLYKARKTKIVVLAGRGTLADIPGSPAVSQVIKKELVELGVKVKDVICEKRSVNTFEQLRELGYIARKKGFKSLTVITNKYHLPRIKAMVQHIPTLTKAFFGCKLAFKSAETVLLKHNSGAWQKIITAAYKSGAMKKRIALEAAGVRQIKEGIYNYRYGNQNRKS